MIWTVCALKQIGNKRPWVKLPWLILRKILSVELNAPRSYGDLEKKNFRGSCTLKVGKNVTVALLCQSIDQKFKMLCKQKQDIYDFIKNKNTYSQLLYFRKLFLCLKNVMVSTAMAQNSILDAIALALEPHWQTSKRPVKASKASV